MVNINLTTGSMETPKTGFPYKKSIITLTVLLVLTFGVYGGIVAYASKVTSDDAALKQQYTAEFNTFLKSNANDVYDFQTRMDLAKGLAAKNGVVIPSLQEVEKVMVAGAYLTSYSYDAQGGALKLAGVGDNFGVIAKQILNLKNSKMFSDVKVGDTSLGEKGKIKFSLELKIK